ncbi:MAG: nucleotidyl transferase AbiEii/AbiGii toxin family protein [Candidatus Woesearchaeota archaeon]
MIPKDILLETGRRKGLTTKDHIEKDYFQEVALSAIFRKTNSLVFKGGTALYKIYKLPRFSEDLDFSVIGDINAKDLIEEIAKSISCEVKTVKQMKGSVIAKLAFKGVLTHENTLRLDISLKNEVMRGFDVKQHVPDYIDINPFTLRVMKLEEIIAEKVHSIFARTKARDLYDLFFLLRLSDFNPELISAKLRQFGIKLDVALLTRRINGLSSLWEKELRPFIFGEVPDYKVVRDFVLGKVRGV